MEKFIKQFVSEKLGGNIDGLLNYDLSQLRGDDMYGCDNREFDCDDTNIARAIYSVVFKDVWPDLTYESITKKKYRGDTINTFNTLFGRIDRSEIKGFDRIAKDSKIRPMVINFYTTYHTIGNMMVLPNKFVGRSSLNLYRGCHHIWRDYIDRFLAELYLNLMGNPNDVKLDQLIKANSFAFKDYYGLDGFKRLIHGLYLEDYIVDDVPMVESAGYYWWKKNLDKQKYLDEALRYIVTSERIIKRRSLLIVNKIKERIG